MFPVAFTIAKLNESWICSFNSYWQSPAWLCELELTEEELSSVRILLMVVSGLTTVADLFET